MDSKSVFNFKLNLLFFLSALMPLTFAYVLQSFFGVMPCVLCIAQRVPFGAIILMCLFSFFTKNEKVLSMLRSASILAFGINTLIGIYQVGLERQWLPIGMHMRCDLFMKVPTNMTEAHEQLFGANAPLALPSCDRADIVMIGISLSEWNVIYCLMCIIIALWYVKRGTVSKV